MENWHDIPNYLGYEASSEGRIRNKASGRVLKPWKQRRGYLVVGFRGNRRELVHRVVLMAFVGQCPKGQEACHRNQIKLDNRLENLRWDTPQNNRAQIEYQRGD